MARLNPKDLDGWLVSELIGNALRDVFVELTLTGLTAPSRPGREAQEGLHIANGVALIGCELGIWLFGLC